MNPSRITRVETTAIRAAGPSVVRSWVGDEMGLSGCYPSGPATTIVTGATDLTERPGLGRELNDDHRRRAEDHSLLIPPDVFAIRSFHPRFAVKPLTTPCSIR